MTRIARALLLSFPLIAIGCQSAAGPTTKPAVAARGPATLPAGDLETQTAAALQASDRATGELGDELRAINNARAIVQHNMSNADTPSYKSTVARCENGGKLACQVDFSQGSLENSGRPLDVGIQGQGFFTFRVGTGKNSLVYSRNGNLMVNHVGELVLNAGDGYTLSPPINIPGNATDITIGVDGTISVLLSGQGAKQQVGEIKLTQFTNSQGLQQQDGIFFSETEASGPPSGYTPGEGGTGQLLQGFLEASNVDIYRESARLHYLDRWRAQLLRAASE